jgi:anti-anti-sigma regulatory factor
VPGAALSFEYRARRAMTTMRTSRHDVLIAAHKRAGAEGREVLLVIASTTVLRVFALTGMDRVIPNFTSLAEALA